jgi:hypothetical protein
VFEADGATAGVDAELLTGAKVADVAEEVDAAEEIETSGVGGLTAIVGVCGIGGVNVGRSLVGLVGCGKRTLMIGLPTV